MEVKKGVDLWKQYNWYKSENKELRYHLDKICKLSFELLLVLYDREIKLPEAKNLKDAIEEVRSNVVV